MVLLIPTISFEDFTIDEDYTNLELDNTLTSLNLVLVIIGGFFSMMLVSKIKYSTINHSLHIAILLIIISIAFYYDKFVGINI